MQLKKFFSVALILLTLASCSKSDDVVAPTPVTNFEGNWVGKLSLVGQPFNTYYSFKLKAGGVLELQDVAQTKTGEGTWTVANFVDNTTGISGTYTTAAPASGTFSFLAKFDKVDGELDGTWGSGTKEYGGGYWFMKKVN